MQTMTLEAEVSTDGMIHLDLPVNLPPGKIDIVLVMQPTINGIKQNGLGKFHQQSRQGLFDEMDRLLRLGLEGVTWEEIKEGRKDDKNRY